MPCPNVLCRECIKCYDRCHGFNCVFSFCKKKVDVRLVRYHMKRFLSHVDTLDTYRDWLSGYFGLYELL